MNNYRFAICEIASGKAGQGSLSGLESNQFLLNFSGAGDSIYIDGLLAVEGTETRISRRKKNVITTDFY